MVQDSVLLMYLKEIAAQGASDSTAFYLRQIAEQSMSDTIASVLGQMSHRSFWDYFGIGLQFISALVIGATAWIYWEQKKVMNASFLGQNLANLYDHLGQEDVIKARRVVITQLYRNGDLKPRDPKWDAVEEEAGEIVCRTFARAGLYIRRNMVSSVAVIEDWHDSISKCYDALVPMLKSYRMNRGDDFWTDFDRLALSAKTYEQKKNGAS